MEGAPKLTPTDLKPDIAEPEPRALSMLLRRLRRLFQVVLLGLVLVLVALVSALTAMRIAIHGREVEVPKLVGLSPVEAESALLDRGLRLELENRFYSDVIPEGRVLSQLPAAGTIVRRGWLVRVAESLGTPRAKVPNVLGQSSRAAEINLRRRGLEVGKLAIVHLPNLPADQVIGVSPPPESVGNSPKVSLLLTAADPDQSRLMPNLVGKRLAVVQQLVAQAGLQLAKGNWPPSISEGSELVIKQSPPAGSKVTPETTITLAVAR